MKKCPYCAEEIQEKARKCKHCGEWLSVPEGIGTDKSDASVEKHDVVGSIEENLDPKAPLSTNTPKYEEIPSVKTIAKKPGKYGWGWFLFLALLANYDMRNNPFSDYTLSFIWGVLTLLFVIPYFVLRWRFIKKWQFPGSKAWKAGLAAAFCTYLLVLAVLATMIVFDSKSLNSRIAGLDAKYRDRVASIKKEENKYQTKLVSEPQNAKDMKRNVETVDEILAYNKEKHRFFHEMFNDYKQSLRDKRRPKADKPWGDSIDQALSLYDRSYEKQTTALMSLKTYYVTGEEKYYENYTAAYRDAAQLATEFQKAVKEMFNVR